jgi:hypothetical protein
MFKFSVRATAQFPNVSLRNPFRGVCSCCCRKRKCYIPVPVRATACGLPPPSSLISSVALRGPVAVGLNVTLIVQGVTAPKVLPQVLGGEREKSPAFAPKIAICHKFIVAAPKFVRVAVFAVLGVPTAWLPKGRLVGARLAAVPTPVRTTVWGLPTALSLMLIEDLRGPAAVGLKVGWRRQLAPGPNGLGQL